MARSRKRPPASFEIPADVASASQSGWVFRSDVQAEKTGTPTHTPPRPARQRRPRAEPVEHPVPAAAAESPRAGGALRFIWLPFAILCSVVIALVPGTGPRSERS